MGGIHGSTRQRHGTASRAENAIGARDRLRAAAGDSKDPKGGATTQAGDS